MHLYHSAQTRKHYLDCCLDAGSFMYQDVSTKICYLSIESLTCTILLMWYSMRQQGILTVGMVVDRILYGVPSMVGYLSMWQTLVSTVLVGASQDRQ